MKSGEIAHPNMEGHTCGIRSMSFDDKEVPKEHDEPSMVPRKTSYTITYRMHGHTPSHAAFMDTHTITCVEHLDTLSIWHAICHMKIKSYIHTQHTPSYGIRRTSCTYTITWYPK